MTGLLDLDRLDRLCIRVVYSRVLEGPAHDVFLVEMRPSVSTGRFDERRYLDCLEPVLGSSVGGGRAPVVVHVNRTHRNWAEGAGEAEIVVGLATGRSTSVDEDAADAIGSAFRRMLVLSGDEAPAAALDQPRALLEARLRVERGYPEVHADRLTVSDEEHVPVSGLWSVGLVLGQRARFRVSIGFVDGDPRTTHIRRLPGSEVVDSLGTGGNS